MGREAVDGGKKMEPSVADDTRDARKPYFSNFCDGETNENARLKKWPSIFHHQYLKICARCQIRKTPQLHQYANARDSPFRQYATIKRSLHQHMKEHIYQSGKLVGPSVRGPGKTLHHRYTNRDSLPME